MSLQDLLTMFSGRVIGTYTPEQYAKLTSGEAGGSKAAVAAAPASATLPPPKAIITRRFTVVVMVITPALCWHQPIFRN